MLHVKEYVRIKPNQASERGISRRGLLSLSCLMSTEGCCGVLVQLDRSLEALREDSYEEYVLQPSKLTLLIVPDRNHTGAVSIVTAAENISTS